VVRHAKTPTVEAAFPEKSHSFKPPFRTSAIFGGCGFRDARRVITSRRVTAYRDGADVLVGSSRERIDGASRFYDGRSSTISGCLASFTPGTGNVTLEPCSFRTYIQAWHDKQPPRGSAPRVKAGTKDCVACWRRTPGPTGRSCLLWGHKLKAIASTKTVAAARDHDIHSGLRIRRGRRCWWICSQRESGAATALSC